MWVQHLPVGQTLFYVEGMFLLHTLKTYNGNKSRACRSLGIKSTKTLRRKLEAFFVVYPEYQMPPTFVPSKKIS